MQENASQKNSEYEHVLHKIAVLMAVFQINSGQNQQFRSSRRYCKAPKLRSEVMFIQVYI